MASAGGHWMKAATGPYAGSMVFVPGVKTGSANEYFYPAGSGSAVTQQISNAKVQGGLAVYQNEAGDFVVAHAESGMSLGPSFTSEAGALMAMEELNQAGGKLWTENAQALANKKGVKELVGDTLNKHTDYDPDTLGQAKADMEALQANYSVNQPKVPSATTATAGQAAKPAAETFNKANPSDYHGSAGDAILGVNVGDGGKIAYNKNTGKYDLIDKDGDVISSGDSLTKMKESGAFALEAAAMGKEYAATQATQAEPSATQAGYKKGTLTQPVPQGASQDFKDYAEDVQVTYKMGKQTTKAGVPIDVGHPEGKPTITFNEKTGKYHANDINGKTISTHDSMGEAGQAIGKMYAPKTPSASFSAGEWTQVTANGATLDGVKIDGGVVTFDKFSGQYTLHTESGTAVPGFTSLETAQVTATALQGTAGSAGHKWGAEIYGSYQAADVAMGKQMADHGKLLTAAEIAGMKSYQTTGYTEINDHLWKGTSASQAKLNHIKNIKSGMAKGKGLPHDMILERKKHAGSSLAKLIDSMQVGSVYHSKGLDSTSIKKDMWGGEYAIKYHAPKGLKGYYMNTSGVKSWHPGEYEFLVAPNTAWKVIGKYKNEYGGYTAEVVFVGQE